MKTKTLSIIVPSYNMEAYLPKCLHSLIIYDEELLHELDVIVVNDGSTDNTSKIANEFVAKYPGVFRVVDKPNGHYGSCINVALPLAIGVFVKVLDADDWVNTEGLRDFLVFLKENEDCDLVVSDYDMVDSRGEILEHHTYSLPARKRFDVVSFTKKDYYVSMHSLTYRLSLLRNMKYSQLEGVAYTDTEWSVVPIAQVKSVVYLKKVVYMRLKGREGQSVSPEVFARNSWMLAYVCIHAAEQIEQLREFSCKCARDYVIKSLVQQLYVIYRIAIENGGHVSDIVSLKDIDSRLKVASKQIYSEIGSVRFSRRMPLRLVSLWRRGAFVLPLILTAHKIYARLRYLGK